jgi:membrane protease YdiL (CAAX protease family)
MDAWTRTDPLLPLSRGALWKVTLGVEGGLLAAAVLVGLVLDEPFWMDGTVDPAAVAGGIVSGILLLGVAVGAVEAPLRFMAAIRTDVDRVMVLFHRATVVDFLAISLLAGAGEEALFRGVLQPAVAAHLGTPMAILLVSVAFGLMHCVSRSYVIFSGALGAAFGFMYAASGNILVPMVAHAAYDFVALVYGVRLRPRLAGSR